jgi:hypothetical protein
MLSVLIQYRPRPWPRRVQQASVIAEIVAIIPYLLNWKGVPSSAMA